MKDYFLKGIHSFHVYCRQLSPGDHIATYRERFPVKYLHHGIFVGGSVGVIHFTGENKRNATIKAGDLKSFCKGHTLLKVRYLNVKPRDPKDVIKIAERLRNNPFEWGEYKLLSHNCEHFATYCKLEEKFRRFQENAKGKFAVISTVAKLLLVQPKLLLVPRQGDRYRSLNFIRY